MVGDIFQPTHLLFVLVVALLVLGPKRLPEVGRQLGNGIRDFRAAMNGERPEPKDEIANVPVEPSHTAAEEPSPHVFAHDAVETVPEEHQFAHSAPEPAANGHEFAHQESGQAAGRPLAGETAKPGGEHKFAYEPSQAPEKPVDPLT